MPTLELLDCPSEPRMEAMEANFKDKISHLDKRSQQILADLKQQLGSVIKDFTEIFKEEQEEDETSATTC